MADDVKLTELEQQWISEVFDDGTGYLDDTRSTIDPKVARGVVSSLIKKGVLVADHDPSRSALYGIATDLFPAAGFEHLFE